MARKKKMVTVNDFIEETYIRADQYKEGLIHKGEFIRGCLDSLNKLMEYDLNEAQRIVESYGFTGNEFSTWMHEQAGKE